MAGQGHDNLVEQCRLMYNNTLDYPREMGGGRIKVARTDRFRISRCIANNNNGSGFWFDIDNRDGIIDHSYAADNVDAGIAIEISQRMTIRNNVAMRNGIDKRSGWASAGILVAESKRCLVEHNISVGNRTGIAVRQQGMRIVDASGDPDRSLPVTFYSERLISVVT